MQKKFLVLYHIPAKVMEGWMKVDAAERQKLEAEMMQKWHEWENRQGSALLSTDGAGRTKLVSQATISDTRNDIVVCSVVMADTHDAASALFQTHPHLTIPEATIEIMELRGMS